MTITAEQAAIATDDDARNRLQIANHALMIACLEHTDVSALTVEEFSKLLHRAEVDCAPPASKED